MSFAFRPVLTGLAALGVAALCGLGTWQLQRLEWKRELVAKVEKRLYAAPIPFGDALKRAGAGEDMEYQPVEIAGVFAHDLEAHVFGTLDGVAGSYVFTPLAAPDARTGETRYIYVNRGFVPQSLDAQAARAGEVPGEQPIVGLFRSAEAPQGVARLVRPKDQPEDNLYFTRDPGVFAGRSAISAPRFYIDSDGRDNSGEWPKGGTTRVEFSNRHLEYALTWFGLAAALIGVYVAYSMRR